jgi:hypothetical protein
MLKGSTKKAQPKIMHLLDRTELSDNCVRYRVQAEVDGERHDPHNVLVVDGSAVECEKCQPWHYRHTCGHADFAEAQEAGPHFCSGRQDRQVVLVTTLTREQFVELFDPHGCRLAIW